MGRDVEEGIEAAKLLAQYGYDALDVDAGSYDAWWWSHLPMYQEIEFEVPEIYLLGDATKVANIMYAIWDAFEVANHI